MAVGTPVVAGDGLPVTGYCGTDWNTRPARMKSALLRLINSLRPCLQKQPLAKGSKKAGGNQVQLGKINPSKRLYRAFAGQQLKFHQLIQPL